MIGGKMLAFSVLNVFIIGLLIATMLIITHVSIGALWLVFLLCFLTAISAAALGIFISSVTYSVAESVQASNLVFFSSIIVSGLIFQPESMSKYIKWVTYILPFTYSIRAMREINLLGMNFYDIQSDLLVVFGFTVLFVIIATVSLRRRAT